MKDKKTKYIVFVGVIILFFFSYYDFNISLLLFFICFQVLSFLGIVSNLKTYLKTRNGIYVKGVIKEVRRIKGEENSSDSYEYLLEYSYPTKENKFFLLHRDSSIKPATKDYNIWINESKVEDSVVVDAFNPYWVYMLLLYSAIIIGLFIADIFLVKAIKNHFSN
jgi:hypothetical protein